MRSNILQNGGEIMISGQIRSEQIIICIQDQGTGISQEDVPHIFDRFFRADEAAKNTQGAGLGLYLSRAIIEAHKGRIWIEPRQEAGTRVCFSIATRLSLYEKLQCKYNKENGVVMARIQTSCPNCNQPMVAEIFQVIDVSKESNSKNYYWRGTELSSMPDLWFPGTIPVPFVYHDKEKELLLTFSPPDTTKQWRKKKLPWRLS